MPEVANSILQDKRHLHNVEIIKVYASMYVM